MKKSLTNFDLFVCGTVILYHMQLSFQYKQCEWNKFFQILYLSIIFYPFLVNIESDSLCSEITKRKIKLDKEHNSALIVKQSRLNDHSLDWQVNKFCKFQVNSVFAQSGGVLAVIQYLNFRRDPITDECIDYIQFRPKDGPYTKKFCGIINATLAMDQQLTDLQKPLVYENSAIDYRGELDVYVNISKKALKPNENADINVVFTSYKRICFYIQFYACVARYFVVLDCSRDHGNDFLIPCSDTIRTFCIYSGFFKDGIVNCPYADCTDENGCVSGFIRIQFKKL